MLPYFFSRFLQQLATTIVCCVILTLPCLAHKSEQINDKSNAALLNREFPRAWDFRFSLFAGHDVAAIFNQRLVASFGACAGFQTATGVYLGGFASIHPLVINGSPTAYIAPIVVGGELGYEFVLSQQSFLRPSIGLGRWGIGGSYRGERLAYSPETELWVLKIGVLYSFEISPDLLLGAEVFALGQVGIRPALHVGVRL